MHKKYGVIVADDSAFMRKCLSDIINSDPELQVIATARNGEDALDKIASLKPDVITLDLEMPVLNGIAALEKIITNYSIPVVMLSAYTQNGAQATIQALEMGAFDFIAKPGGTISADIMTVQKEIITKIKAAIAAKFDLMQKKRSPDKRQRPLYQVPTGNSAGRHAMVLIGTSTGGPKALHQIFTHLPNDLCEKYNVSFLIVQHMPPGFTNSLAQRLDSISSLRVKEAENGERIKPGYAYVAPGAYHMLINQNMGGMNIELNQSSLVNGHRPSVDMLFKSAAQLSIPRIGVILTGMGQDGALGLKLLKESGAITIGENAETCVVFGMPKAAYEMGGVDIQVPLDMIAINIIKVLAAYR